MTRYQRNSDIEGAPLQEETILYNPSTNEFCVLNQTAAFLWEQLAQPCTEEELSDRLRGGFANSESSDISRDVRETLRQFQELQILVASD